LYSQKKRPREESNPQCSKKPKYDLSTESTSQGEGRDAPGLRAHGPFPTCLASDSQLFSTPHTEEGQKYDNNQTYQAGLPSNDRPQTQYPRNEEDERSNLKRQKSNQRNTIEAFGFSS